MLKELSCNGFAKIGVAGTRSECMRNVGSNLVAAAVSPYLSVVEREVTVETRKKKPTWNYWGPVGRLLGTHGENARVAAQSGTKRKSKGRISARNAQGKRRAKHQEPHRERKL